MCEFAPARLAREARRSRVNRMLARPSCPAPMALVTFPERKVTRADGAEKTWMSDEEDIGFRQRAAVHGQELRRRNDDKIGTPCATTPRSRAGALLHKVDVSAFSAAAPRSPRFHLAPAALKQTPGHHHGGAARGRSCASALAPRCPNASPCRARSVHR